MRVEIESPRQPKRADHSQRSSFDAGNSNSSEKPSTPYDDRVIPTLRHNVNAKSHQPTASTIINEQEELATAANEAVVPESELEQEMYDPIDGTEEMTEREVREAALMNEYIGKQIVTKLYSKNFQNREDAILEVYNNLVGYKGEPGEEPKALFRASAILVAKMAKDNVFSIFNNAIRLFQYLLNDFAKLHQSIGKQEMNYALERCLPVLLHRTGDTNARLRQRAHEFIVEMAEMERIKPLNAVPNHLTAPMKLHMAPRLALSQIEIIEELMRTLGIKENGLTVDNLAKFCAHALQHTSGEVRELATKMLIQLYRESGGTVRKYLPQDNEMTRRNKKYRVLFEAFDGIEGKPTQSYEKMPGMGAPYELAATPRFNARNVKTPVKSKTPNRSTSVDRKTPISIADESEYNPDKYFIISYNFLERIPDSSQKLILNFFENEYDHNYRLFLYIWIPCVILRSLICFPKLFMSKF